MYPADKSNEDVLCAPDDEKGGCECGTPPITQSLRPAASWPFELSCTHDNFSLVVARVLLVLCSHLPSNLVLSSICTSVSVDGP